MTDQTPTRSEAEAEFASRIGAAIDYRDSLPPRDAAELVHHAHGKTTDEIEQMIRDRRYGKAAS